MQRIVHAAPWPGSVPTIPQRELRNDVSDVLRRAEAGERFTITVDGRPVAELGPRPAEVGHSADTWAALVALGPDDDWAAELRRMRDEDEAAAVDPWR